MNPVEEGDPTSMHVSPVEWEGGKVLDQLPSNHFLYSYERNVNITVFMQYRIAGIFHQG